MSELILDKDYHLWRDKKYLGVATFKEDEIHGEAFIRIVVGENGMLMNEIFIADKWEESE